MTSSQLLYSYPGSKKRLAPSYCRHLPRHRVLVDLFGGTGAIFTAKTSSHVEIYNDLDNAVYNVFAVLQDLATCEELVRLIEATPNGRRQYEVCRDVLADATESKVRRAWAFLVCGNIGFSVHPRLANSWARPDKQKHRLLSLPPKLDWWQNRFRRVYLENQPWQTIIDKYDGSDVFFFADPPYLGSVLRSPVDAYYTHVMTATEHVELIERLRTIRGYAMLCGYNHPKYTELLFHWRKVSFSTRMTMGGAKREKRQEQIWLNYEEDGSKVEDNRLRIARRYVRIMGGVEEAMRYLDTVKRLMELPK